MQLTTAAPVQLAPAISTVNVDARRLDLAANTIEIIVFAPGTPPVRDVATLPPALLTALQNFVKARVETALGVANGSTTLVVPPPPPAAPAPAPVQVIPPGAAPLA